MGIMDKVKAQAEQAMAKAQQGVAQGQGKFDALQAKRAADKLLHDLGVAVYAERRSGGPQAAVDTALAALDAHVAEHGPLDPTASAELDPTQPTGAPPPPPPPPPVGDGGPLA
jgi:hypothetical protein